jgi:hypothetical protein
MAARTNKQNSGSYIVSSDADRTRGKDEAMRLIYEEEDELFKESYHSQRPSAAWVVRIPMSPTRSNG